MLPSSVLYDAESIMFAIIVLTIYAVVLNYVYLLQSVTSTIIFRYYYYNYSYCYYRAFLYNKRQVIGCDVANASNSLANYDDYLDLLQFNTELKTLQLNDNEIKRIPPDCIGLNHRLPADSS